MERSRGANRLSSLLRDAADGVFPPDDGLAEVVSPCLPGREWVVSFTAHAVIATTLPVEEVHAQHPDGLGRAVGPEFLLWLAGEGGSVGCQDAVLVARTRGGGTLPRRDDLNDHPRVRLARGRRTGVVAYGDERGLVTLGRGLAGLAEMSVEVAGEPGRGHGRALIEDALGLVDAGDIILAQVTPGNARSLRAFLTAGFVPIGSAVAVEPGVRQPRGGP
jgi:hypothetical protein